MAHAESEAVEVVEILEVAPPPALEVGGVVERHAAHEEVEPLVAPAVDRDAGVSAVPEAVAPPAPQAGGSVVEVLAAPEASVQPQDAADCEGPNLSGDDIAAFQAELERCLSGPEEPAAEASVPSAFVVTAAVDMVGANPESPRSERLRQSRPLSCLWRLP
jgi:hypothetical protein